MWKKTRKLRFHVVSGYIIAKLIIFEFYSVIINNLELIMKNLNRININIHKYFVISIKVNNNILVTNRISCLDWILNQLLWLLKTCVSVFHNIVQLIQNSINLALIHNVNITMKLPIVILIISIIGNYYVLIIRNYIIKRNLLISKKEFKDKNRKIEDIYLENNQWIYIHSSNGAGKTTSVIFENKIFKHAFYWDCTFDDKLESSIIFKDSSISYSNFISGINIAFIKWYYPCIIIDDLYLAIEDNKEKKYLETIYNLFSGYKDKIVVINIYNISEQIAILNKLKYSSKVKNFVEKIIEQKKFVELNNKIDESEIVNFDVNNKKEWVRLFLWSNFNYDMQNYRYINNTDDLDIYQLLEVYWIEFCNNSNKVPNAKKILSNEINNVTNWLSKKKINFFDKDIYYNPEKINNYMNSLLSAGNIFVNLLIIVIFYHRCGGPNMILLGQENVDELLIDLLNRIKNIVIDSDREEKLEYKLIIDEKNSNELSIYNSNIKIIGENNLNYFKDVLRNKDLNKYLDNIDIDAISRLIEQSENKNKLSNFLIDFVKINMSYIQILYELPKVVEHQKNIVFDYKSSQIAFLNLPEKVNLPKDNFSVITNKEQYKISISVKYINKRYELTMVNQKFFDNYLFRFNNNEVNSVKKINKKFDDLFSLLNFLNRMDDVNLLNDQNNEDRDVYNKIKLFVDDNCNVVGNFLAILYKYIPNKFDSDKQKVIYDYEFTYPNKNFWIADIDEIRENFEYIIKNDLTNLENVIQDFENNNDQVLLVYYNFVMKTKFKDYSELWSWFYGPRVKKVKKN